MDALHLTLVIIHSLGAFAILVGAIGVWAGGALGFQYTLLWSARLQVLTGVGLAALAFVDDEANVLKLVVKLLIALVVAGLSEMSVRRDNKKTLMMGVTALTVANIAVAVAWH